MRSCRLIATVLSALCVPAGAAVATPELDALTVELPAVLGAPGEGKDRFLARVATSVRDATRRRGAEICGALAASADGRWGLVPATQGSQLHCVVRTDRVPPGMKATGETLHSHVEAPDGVLRTTVRDRTLAALLGDADAAVARAMRVRPERFSMHDYAGGPGYLVVGARLSHQAGRGRDRPLGRVDPERAPRLPANVTLSAAVVVDALCAGSGGTRQADQRVR